MKLQLATPVKGTSWPDLILQVPMNEEGWENDASKDHGRPFPLEKESSIRPVVSGKIKDRFPLRVYSVKKEVLNGRRVLMVRWEKNQKPNN